MWRFPSKSDPKSEKFQLLRPNLKSAPKTGPKTPITYKISPREHGKPQGTPHLGAL